MEEEAKFSPGLGAMDMESLEGAGKAAQSLTNRRFKAFEGDIQIIIDMGIFDEDNTRLVKELKLGVGDTLTRYEEILARLEAIYSVKPDKYKQQLKEMNENFGLIDTRRYTVRSKCLEAAKAIEDERNKKEAKSLAEDRTLTGARGAGGGGGGDNMFKMPTGPLPEKISLEYTPLQADN